MIKLHFLSIVMPNSFFERKAVIPLGQWLGEERGVLRSQLLKLPPNIQEPAQGPVVQGFAELRFALVKCTLSNLSFFTFPNSFTQTFWKITPDPWEYDGNWPSSCLYKIWTFIFPCCSFFVKETLPTQDIIQNLGCFVADAVRNIISSEMPDWNRKGR